MSSEEVILEAWRMGWKAASKFTTDAFMIGKAPTKKQAENYAVKELTAALKLLGEKKYAE